jgi:alpha-glucosidase
MTLEVEAVDWSKARTKPKTKRAVDRPKNIFAGNSFMETATIEGVPVTRLSALPKGASSIPQSFSVIAQAEWKTNDKATLPYKMEWQQSKPGRFDFYFDLPFDAQCLGLGERFSQLNLRGAKHTLCSTDNFKHSEAADSLYKAVPFLLIVDGDKCTGLYLDSSAPQRWDLDTEMDGIANVELYTRRGWRLHVIGPAPMADVVKCYTSMIGRAKLPPRWSLGHQQCRWSYPDEATVRYLMKEFRTRKIPNDTIVLDIDYMDEYRVFTNSPTRFPNIKELIADAAKENYKIVCIVDPGVKVDPDYDLFKDAKAKDLFVKTPGGKLFIDEVWPGLSAFPDFMKEETRQWWAKHHKWHTDMGVAGIWNDMNEPAFFGARQPLPDDADELPPESQQYFMQETPEGVVGHFEVRNLYGMMMCQATYEGLLMERPNERPFVLSRSGCAGVQRYAAVWTGDNTSWYDHLGKSMPMLINLGLSGLAFNGADIGGFGGDAQPELLVRWYELGMFYPFFRNHCVMQGRSQEPWMFNQMTEDKIRHLIEWRYRLLPYIQGLFWENMRTGAPLMRPMSWHYPKDANAAEAVDQFMFGKDMLVAPIFDRSRTRRNVYFPEGKWHALEGGKAYEGGKSHMVEIKLGTVPAFVREGAVIPLADIMQSTAEYDKSAITFLCYGDKAEGTYFEDDGISFDFEKGNYNEWNITVNGGTFSASAAHKKYKAPSRTFKMLHNGTEKKVEL